jgi:hypothetical protein
MNDQNGPGMNQKSGRVSRKLGHFSKTDVRFWQDRLFWETYPTHHPLRCVTTTDEPEESSHAHSAAAVLALLTSDFSPLCKLRQHDL